MYNPISWKSITELLTWEGRGGHGGEEIAGEVQLHQVGQATEGRGVDLSNVAVWELQFLEVEQSVATEDFTGEDLEIVPSQVQNLQWNLMSVLGDKRGNGSIFPSQNTKGYDVKGTSA